MRYLLIMLLPLILLGNSDYVNELYKYLDNKQFRVNGLFATYDFNKNGKIDYNDWLYFDKSSKKTFQLLGNKSTKNNPFGWKATDVKIDPKKVVGRFVYIKFPGDSSNNYAFSWIYLSKGKIYKLMGSTQKGTFRYLDIDGDGAPDSLPFTYNITNYGRYAVIKNLKPIDSDNYKDNNLENSSGVDESKSSNPYSNDVSNNSSSTENRLPGDLYKILDKNLFQWYSKIPEFISYKDYFVTDIHERGEGYVDFRSFIHGRLMHKKSKEESEVGGKYSWFKAGYIEFDKYTDVKKCVNYHYKLLLEEPLFYRHCSVEDIYTKKDIDPGNIKRFMGSAEDAVMITTDFKRGITHYHGRKIPNKNEFIDCVERYKPFDFSKIKGGSNIAKEIERYVDYALFKNNYISTTCSDDFYKLKQGEFWSGTKNMNFIIIEKDRHVVRFGIQLRVKRD